MFFFKSHWYSYYSNDFFKNISKKQYNNKEAM